MSWASRVASGFTRPGYHQFWKLTPFEERGVESPSFSFGDNRDQAQRQYFIPWLNNPNTSVYAAWQASKDFLGFTSVQQSQRGFASTNKYLSRSIPHPLPSTALQPARTDGFTAWQFAKDITRWEISREAGQDTARIGVGREAIMTVVYSSFPYTVLDDMQCARLSNIATLLAVGDPCAAPGMGFFPDEACMGRYVYSYFEPGGKWQAFKGFSTILFNRDNAPLVWEENVLLNDGDLFVDWYQIPTGAIPITAIQNCIGKTNRYNFNVGMNTGIGTGGPSVLGIVPPGKLIMAVPKFDKPFRMADGNWATNIRYRFKWKPFGANFFYRPNPPRGVSGTWSEVLFPGGGSLNVGNATVVVNSTSLMQDMDWIEFRDNTVNGGTGRPYDDGIGYGSYQIHKIDGTTVELINTVNQSLPPTFQGRNGATGTWAIAPGWYSASRFSLGATSTQFLSAGTTAGAITIGNPRNSQGQLFNPIDYSDLFRPEP